MEEFYADIEEVLKQTPKKDIVHIIGDFNVNVRSVEIGIIGQFGLGE